MAAGCSGSPSQSSVVSGRVAIGGTPLIAGTVLLITDDGRAASADVQPDGSYRAQAQPGRYKVAVNPPPAPDPLASPARSPPPRPVTGTPTIPKRYHDFGTSGLSVELKPGNNAFDILLTP